jgi:NTP pyrophosphatase (non-canonical NTP hydrolase)
VRRFQELGLAVLSPSPSRPISTEAEFVVLETDESRDPKTLEHRHLDAIIRATALYIVNDGGYIGPSTAMELGWALAFGKRVYAKEPPEDVLFRHIAGSIGSLQDIVVASPDEVKYELMNGLTHVPGLDSSLSLSDLQEYVRRVAEQRGFNAETAENILTLMVEEFGELAKAVRVRVNLKTDYQSLRPPKEIGHELADLLFYLLHLSNTCQVDLYRALESMEHRNLQRRWESREELD